MPKGQLPIIWAVLDLMPRLLPVPQIHPAVLRMLIALSFALLGLATVFFFGYTAEVSDNAPLQLIIAWLMTAIGAMLLVGEQDDQRARWFGRFLVFSATAFCFGPIKAHADSSDRLLDSLPAHLAVMAIAPYCLWRLAAEFPRTIDRSAMRRAIQAGTVLAWFFASAAFVANLALWMGFSSAAVLDHGPGDGLFQLLSILLNAAALLVIAVRWLSASQRDRRRSGPFLATLGVLAFMLAAVVAASVLRTPMDATLAAFGTAVIALLPCLAIAIRQRGLYVRMLGAGPLLRHAMEGLAWAVLAVPVIYFWFRWSTQKPAFDLQLLFVGSLIAVFIAARPRRRLPNRRAEAERADLIRGAPLLSSRLQRDEWLGRVQDWSRANGADLFAAHSEQVGVMLDPLPEEGQSLLSLLYLHRRTIDLDHIDPLEFARLAPETRRWIAERRLALVEPILSATDHLLGLLVLGRPTGKTAHGAEAVALLPILAAGLAPAIQRSSADHEPQNASREEPRFGAALCPACEAVFSSLVEACPDCARDLATLDKPLLVAGNYQLEKRLGRGSWGSVFQARDLLLERAVALKFFHLGGEQGSTALLREARALVSLRGPQLNEIFGAVQTEHGLALITALLEGGVLSDRMEAGKPAMEWREAMQLGLELLASLTSLHDRDLVHGDIKPSNIGFDGEGRLKLIDFGMVRALRDGSLPSTPSSNALAKSTLLPGGQPGTPIYSPPEAWDGEPTGVANDLWPVAVVLWELMTGEHPFVRPGDDLQALGQRIRRGETNPWPQAINRSPRLDAFFERALHVDPGRRYVDLPAMERAMGSVMG